MAKTRFSIEEAFEELDQIVKELESSELNLSDSMNLYKKGVRLLDKCSQTLDKTEKEIIVLQEGQNGTILKREDSE
ncbi:MAG: exodeoxyribonuclease VII small subunit [Lachnospiraceae bacterium]|nr:exodeoxyribonuclease VII small subunit [Lachnospiraceae bacterium]